MALVETLLPAISASTTAMEVHNRCVLLNFSIFAAIVEPSLPSILLHIHYFDEYSMMCRARGFRVPAEYLRRQLHKNVEKVLREAASKGVEECLKAAFLMTG